MPQKRRPETQINMAYPESNMEFYGKFPEHVENQNLSGFTGILPGNGSLGSFQFPYSNLGSMAGNVTQMTPILLNQQKQTGFMQKPYIITNHQQLPNQTSNSMISSVNSLENFLVEFGNKINVLFANQN